MALKQFKKLYVDSDSVKEPINLVRVINSLQVGIDESISPLINRVQNDSLILKSIALNVAQNNIINHTLGRPLTGWKIVRQRAQADFWDTQDNNPSPNLTLWLSSSADCTVDIEVF